MSSQEIHRSHSQILRTLNLPERSRIRQGSNMGARLCVKSRLDPFLHRAIEWILVWRRQVQWKGHMGNPGKNQSNEHYSDLYIGIAFLLILGISAFLLIFIFPKFKEIFDAFENLELPLISRLMMNPLFQVIYLVLLMMVMASYFYWRRRTLPEYVHIMFLTLMGLSVVLIILTVFLPVLYLQSRLGQTG